MPDTSQLPANADLRALTDQCVMCGLCLPHCPTYRLERHEAESPRGRIAVARLLASGQLAPSANAIAHLDHCLGCLACEVVCPSDVRYEQILVQSRALLEPARPASLRRWRWLHDPARLRFLARLGKPFQAFRWAPWLGRVLPGTSRLGRILREMPRPPGNLPAPLPVQANMPSRGSLTLFAGCLGHPLDADTVAAARNLLMALGFRVIEPAGSPCCGALALHAGDAEDAARQAHHTRNSLDASPSDAVLVIASGCLRSLRDHALQGTQLVVDDVLAFLAADEQIARLRFRPLPKRAALMVPCSQIANGTGSAPVKALLSRIAELEVQLMPEQPRCCGAAGNYFIESPSQADRLRAEKLDQLDTLKADLLLTSNIGCRVFLDNGLRHQGRNIPVMHPLTLLARQLEPQER